MTPETEVPKKDDWFLTSNGESAVALWNWPERAERERLEEKIAVLTCELEQLRRAAGASHKKWLDELDVSRDKDQIIQNQNDSINYCQKRIRNQRNEIRELQRQLGEKPADARAMLNEIGRLRSGLERSKHRGMEAAARAEIATETLNAAGERIKEQIVEFAGRIPEEMSQELIDIADSMISESAASLLTDRRPTVTTR